MGGGGGGLEYRGGSVRGVGGDGGRVVVGKGEAVWHGTKTAVIVQTIPH